jgi:hypothetical protein
MHPSQVRISFGAHCRKAAPPHSVAPEGVSSSEVLVSFPLVSSISSTFLPQGRYDLLCSLLQSLARGPATRDLGYVLSLLL